MTMREEFEAWWTAHGDATSAPVAVQAAIWQAAYRAGQEAMRERAAKEVEGYEMDDDDPAERIRALPIE